MAATVAIEIEIRFILNLPEGFTTIIIHAYCVLVKR
jgi:hypothetical protein